MPVASQCECHREEKQGAGSRVCGGATASLEPERGAGLAFLLSHSHWSCQEGQAC